MNITTKTALVAIVIISACPATLSQVSAAHKSLDNGSHCSLSSSPTDQFKIQLSYQISEQLTHFLKKSTNLQKRQQASYLLTLAKNGEVAAVEVAKPSGDKEFDAFAVQAIKKAGPYGTSSLAERRLTALKENLSESKSTFKFLVEFPALRAAPVL